MHFFILKNAFWTEQNAPRNHITLGDVPHPPATHEIIRAYFIQIVVVVAQLAPDVRGSIPVISKICIENLFIVNCSEN